MSGGKAHWPGLWRRETTGVGLPPDSRSPGSGTVILSCVLCAQLACPTVTIDNRTFPPHCRVSSLSKSLHSRRGWKRKDHMLAPPICGVKGCSGCCAVDGKGADKNLGWIPGCGSELTLVPGDSAGQGISGDVAEYVPGGPSGSPAPSCGYFPGPGMRSWYRHTLQHRRHPGEGPGGGASTMSTPGLLKRLPPWFLTAVLAPPALHNPRGTTVWRGSALRSGFSRPVLTVPFRLVAVDLGGRQVSDTPSAPGQKGQKNCNAA